MVRFGAVSASILALALAGCGGSKDKEAPLPTSEATAEVADSGPAKPVGFIPCMSCHSVKPGQNGVGPSLAGVFGRKAAAAPGFEYSAAMKASGKTWDEATLDTYLTNPMGVVPSTRMTYMGQSDPVKRKAVIEYLKTLK
jgi:cytochrome c